MIIRASTWKKSRAYKSRLRLAGFDFTIMRGRILEFDDSTEKVYLWTACYGNILKSWQRPTLQNLISDINRMDTELSAIREGRL